MLVQPQNRFSHHEGGNDRKRSYGGRDGRNDDKRSRNDFGNAPSFGNFSGFGNRGPPGGNFADYRP